MERRTEVINIRVTASEKRIIARNAGYCGLTTSNYLRLLGYGHNPKGISSHTDNSI